MAAPEAILSILEDLVNAYPGKQMTDANFKIYIEHLSDIHYDLLRLAADNLIASSTWFPRVSELRDEAARIVGSRNVSSWEPPQDLLRARFLQLENEFYNQGKLDPESWQELADQFDRRDRPHSAESTRHQFTILQQIQIGDYQPNYEQYSEE